MDWMTFNFLAFIVSSITVVTVPSPTDATTTTANTTPNDNLGTQFVFAIPDNYNFVNGGLYLFIESRFGPSTIYMEAPNRGSLYNGSIAKGVTKIRLNLSTVQTQTSVYSDAVHLTTSTPVSVHLVDSSSYSTDGAMILPVYNGPSEYFIVSYTPTPTQYIDIVSKSEITIATLHDGTAVSIQLKTSSGTVDFSGREYSDGDTIHVTLNRLDSLQLQHTSDLTGTRVTSNHPISVLSGDSCVNIPAHQVACDHIFDQVPPVSEWGSTYILTQLKTKLSVTFRIVAARDDTNVKIGSTITHTLDRGEFLDERLTQRAVVMIQCDKPVLLVQFSEGGNGPGDPFMAVVPSVDRFSNGYIFSTPDNFASNYVTVTVETMFVQGLRLNGQNVSKADEKWAVVMDDGLSKNFSVIRLSIGSGDFNLTHDSGAKFGALLYGFGSYVSYGYSLGYTFKTLGGSRLVNGDGPMSGFLELLVGGTWLRACAGDIGLNEATAICRAQGHYKYPLRHDGIRYTRSTHAMTENQHTVQCLGDESDITRCRFTSFNHTCTMGEVFIDCDCRSPPATSSGYFSATNKEYNTSVTYFCCRGYELTGSPNQTCFETAKLRSDVKPTCTPKHLPCHKETDYRGTFWNETSPGTMVERNCIEENSKGKISRICTMEGRWKPPLYSCIREQFVKTTKEIQILLANSSGVEAALSLLDNTTSNDQGLYGGEIKAVVSALSTVVDISKQNGSTSQANTEAFFSTASNLLDKKNEQSWNSDTENSEEERRSEGVKLIGLIDTYGEVVAKSLNKDENKTISKPNMEIQVVKLGDQNRKTNIVFPSLNKRVTTKSHLFLPKESLAESTSYVSVLYNDLTGVLPGYTAENSKNDAGLNSAVLSLTLVNHKQTTLKLPVRLTFEHLTDMDISPSGQKFSPGDSAEPRHTGERFLIPRVRYPYPTWILMMDSYNLFNYRKASQIQDAVTGTSQETNLANVWLRLSYYGGSPTWLTLKPPNEGDDGSMKWGATIPGLKVKYHWDTNGCVMVSTSANITVCECNHLTNFAILMSPWEKENIDNVVIDLITYIGCGVSSLCLLITVAVHLVLWRYVKADRVVILINLSIALVISYVVFLVGVEQTENKTICTAVAVSLHYIYLAVFFLMLAESVEIGVTVLYVFPAQNRLKWQLPLAWGTPAVIVGASAGITRLEGYGTDTSCWLSTDDELIWSFVGPASAIILINFVILILVMRAMFRTTSTKLKSLKSKMKSGIRCLCILLPLMGTSWILGVFYVSGGAAWIQYIFAACNSLQGTVIFILHCLFNEKIRAAIKSKRRKRHDSILTSKSRSSTLPSITEQAASKPGQPEDVQGISLRKVESHL